LLYFWILFNLFCVGMLALDLMVFHRKGRSGAPARSGWLGAPYGSASLSPFAGLIFFWQGRQVLSNSSPAMYCELSLSVDNFFFPCNLPLFRCA